MVFRYCQLPVERIRSRRLYRHHPRRHSRIQTKTLDGSRLRPTITVEHVEIRVGIYREHAQRALRRGRQQDGSQCTSPTVVQATVDLVGGFGTEGGVVHWPSGK